MISLATNEYSNGENAATGHHGTVPDAAPDAAIETAADWRQLKPAIADRINGLEQLADRVDRLADQVEGKLTAGIEELKKCVQTGTEAALEIRAHAVTGAQRVSGLIDHGYELSGRLEAHLRMTAARVDQLADHSLMLAQKIEKGLVRVHETNRSVQAFLDRYREGLGGRQSPKPRCPADEILSRCGEILSALEAAARALQKTTKFIERSIILAAAVASFPVRMVRGAWRAAGLPSKRVSVRKISLRVQKASSSRLDAGSRQ